MARAHANNLISREAHRAQRRDNHGFSVFVGISAPGLIDRPQAGQSIFSRRRKVAAVRITR